LTPPGRLGCPIEFRFETRASAVTQSAAYQPPISRSQPTQLARSLAYAESLCRANQARLTPIRRRVLEALYKATRPLGAYDLADRLGDEFGDGFGGGVAPRGRRVAPITVYRALDFLIEQGLAYRLASLNAYIASSQACGGHGSTALLICEGCGLVSEVPAPELSEALSKLHENHAFTPYARVLELTGRCGRC